MKSSSLAKRTMGGSVGNAEEGAESFLPVSSHSYQMKILRMNLFNLKSQQLLLSLISTPHLIVQSKQKLKTLQAEGKKVDLMVSQTMTSKASKPTSLLSMPARQSIYSNISMPSGWKARQTPATEEFSLRHLFRSSSIPSVVLCMKSRKISTCS